MSFLAPLYFLAALAVAGPIIFHLIRRQPKGEVEFSSLMFLDATPPRLTRRSRLENWPLLLLRCAAILALAFAFARPFLPLAQSDEVDAVSKAVVVLIDQSASMQRRGLWEQARSKAIEIIEGAESDTLISVVGFDSVPRVVLSLKESAGMSATNRKAAAMDAIKELAPTFESTDLGRAIRFAADQATQLDVDGQSVDGQNEDGSRSGQLAPAAVLETRVVLLSDLQSGAKIESLQGYEWPDRVWLDPQSVTAMTVGNATVRVTSSNPLASETDETNDDRLFVRVQVSREDEGTASTFRLRFDGQEQDVDVIQVPAGATRFVSVPLPPIGPDARQNTTAETGFQAATIRISGDADEFDNEFHFLRPKRVEQTVLFVSDDASETRSGDPRERLAFYVRQIPFSDPTRQVNVEVRSASDWRPDALDAERVPLAIFQAGATVVRHVDRIESYLNSGGRAVVVLDKEIDESAGNAIARLLGSPDLSIQRSEAEDYRLISFVDFQSALIRPLSDPGVNDFSNIRIWESSRLANLSESVSALLRLDDGSPLLVQRTFDADNEVEENSGNAKRSGRLWVLAAGWQPAQSQLALSTKFVPILLGMLAPNRQVAPGGLLVGDTTVDGERADRPGVFRSAGGDAYAVNMDFEESRTAAIDPDRLAQLGAIVSSPQRRTQDEATRRALRDVELEARQGWWQWLIVATMIFIAGETLLAARKSSYSESAA